MLHMEEQLSIPRPRMIISGGQTGVDRAALDVALALGIPHGGFCPLGRRAEDGRIAEDYDLTELDSPDYKVRTERNVLAAEATLILCRGALTGGTRSTHRLAGRHGRPCLVINLGSPLSRREIAAWLAQHGQGVLNIAGPRESQSAGIAAAARMFLLALWQVRVGA
jgi:hypothetical protein